MGEEIEESGSMFLNIWAGSSIERWLVPRTARQKMKNGDYDLEGLRICFRHERTTAFFGYREPLDSEGANAGRRGTRLSKMGGPYS